MNQIRELFDAEKDVFRPIEKVINYQSNDASILAKEIAEYIVTDHIEDQFRKLLEDMQLAMENGGDYDVGVWVSGFYGSGKSSFTKYFGMAFDTTLMVDGIPFYKLLQNRFRDDRTKALLTKLVQHFPAAVVMLDLASEMTAGASQKEVSTVLYYKVLKWAGYSQILKVASLEKKLQEDGLYDAFQDKFFKTCGITWAHGKDNVLLLEEVLPLLAREFYPKIFRENSTFSADAQEFITSENDRVKEMIDIVRKHSGKEHIIFIIDELGQYVGSRQSLILNLQGLAENIKRLGQGKVWLLSTAQQRLTEDDARIALNSPELYKLKDRFPINVDLQAKDIKEIAIRRLLGKSISGRQTLQELYQHHGAALQHHTKLQNARPYSDVTLNAEVFADLYPFLPPHFDILLQLLSALARSTGGVGLRSALKVVQEILIEEDRHRQPVANESVGFLVTSSLIYLSLEKDIARAYPTYHAAVERVMTYYPDQPMVLQVAHTIAILQILGNLPATAKNIASLLHPHTNAASVEKDVEETLETLTSNVQIPLTEQDGGYRFISERLTEIDREIQQSPIHRGETLRVFHETLKDAFPTAHAHIHQALSVKGGLKNRTPGDQWITVDGDQYPIQFVTCFVEPADLERLRQDLITQSSQRSQDKTIFILAPEVEDAQQLLADIFRCEETGRKYRNDADQEVRTYVQSKMDRAKKLRDDLKQRIQRGLRAGSFIFRGSMTSVETVNPHLEQAACKQLETAASQIFDRFALAPLQAETSLAERFLRKPLNAITSSEDPLGLVTLHAGQPKVQHDHPALQSIRDHLERTGSIDGGELTRFFNEPPFGWSKDTTRYLLAVLLVSGEINIRIAGREVVAGDQRAIDALKSNQSFKNAGINLRLDRPNKGVLSKASQRLSELFGEPIMPLEDDIQRKISLHLPTYLSRISELKQRIGSLGLAGHTRLVTLHQHLSDIIAHPGQAVPQFGAEDADVYLNLQWALKVMKALDQGLETTIIRLKALQKDLTDLPDTPDLRDLRIATQSDMDQVSTIKQHAEFYKQSAELNDALTRIENEVCQTVQHLLRSHADQHKKEKEQIVYRDGWDQLTRDQQQRILDELERTSGEVTPNMEGLKLLINLQYQFSITLQKLFREIGDLTKDRSSHVQEKPRASAGSTNNQQLILPSRIARIQDVEALLRQLQDIQQALTADPTLWFTLQISETTDDV